MDIHVVQPGDTLYQLARQYGVSMDQLLRDNQLPNPAQLVVGQTIVVRYPETVHQVKEGDTLWSIARMHQISVRQLLRNNPGLGGAGPALPRADPGGQLPAHPGAPPVGERLRLPQHRPGPAGGDPA